MKEEKQRPRRAQLVAEAVSVCCPYCGDAQPNAHGSEMWTLENFEDTGGTVPCISCDAPIIIGSDSHAQFGR